MHEQAMIDAINADPSDVTARLVYADWVAEHRSELEAEGWRLLARAGKQAAMAEGHHEEFHDWYISDTAEDINMLPARLPRVMFSDTEPHHHSWLYKSFTTSFAALRAAAARYAELDDITRAAVGVLL